MSLFSTDTKEVITCLQLFKPHLLSVVSWLAEGRSCERLESVVELCVDKVEGKWEEGAGALFVLIFRAGDSGFGVDDAEEAKEKIHVL